MLRIYKSSAGSGKTFTLVREYLRLALSGDTEKYKHILAITFTNKAANEMKSRIISALREITGDISKSSMAKELLPLLHITANVLQERAGYLLEDILHNYSDLSVSTIDSFVHRLIRSFAYDLHLSSDFEIEMDSNMLLTMAVEKLMDSAKEDEASQVTKALIDFAENNLTEGKGWNLEFALINFSRELFNEDSNEFIKKLADFKIDDFIQTRDRLYAVKLNFENRIKQPAKQAFDLICSQGLDESHFYQTRSSIFKYFLNLSGDPASAKCEPNSYVQKTISEGKWVSTKITDRDKAKIDTIKSELTHYYNEIKSLRDDGESTYILAKLLLKNIYSFMLLTEIKRMLEEYKQENNILHISEFQERISRIVNEQDAPIIYERIGDWYDCVLIDEFQDTSVLQWRNLLPLIENSQMKVQDSLIVGDGKQAIYRFRGGEVEQFAALPLVYQSEGNYMLQAREVAIMNYGTEELSLVRNFRSRKEIIEFNNTLYDAIALQPEFGHKHIYTDHAQQQGRDMQGGYVSIEFLEKTDEIEYREALCYHVEALIQNVREKGYAWSDIAILTRTNDIGSDIASYLLQQHIPVVSSESLLIGRSHEVRAIVSFLYYMSDKDNLIRRAEILYYFAPGLMTANGGEAYERLRGGYLDFEKYISSLCGADFDSDQLIQNRLPELIQSLIRKFPFLQKNDAFIQFFMDEVLEYSVKNGNRVNEFLKWWEDNKSKKSIIYPDTMDAVRVLTIHRAKGLQYPVVIIPDADFKLRNTKRFLWAEMEGDLTGNISVFPLPVQADLENTNYGDLYKKEMADSLLDMVNLLYVATTRPEDRLYLISERPEKEPEKLNSITALLVRVLQHLDIWDGFSTYEFGDSSTSKIAGKDHEKMAEFTYSPVMNQNRKSMPIKSSAAQSEDTAPLRSLLLAEVMKEMKYEKDGVITLNKYLISGRISLEEKNDLEKDIQELFLNKDIAILFSDTLRVYSNKQIIAGNKFTHRADRLLIHKESGRAVIVNFRQGNEHDKHVKEVTDYARVLKEKGMGIDDSAVIYTDSKTVVKILV